MFTQKEKDLANTIFGQVNIKATDPMALDTIATMQSFLVKLNDDPQGNQEPTKE